MATQSTAVNDDSPNSGTNNAPSINGLDLDVPTTGSDGGNGQKPTVATPGSNPDGTTLRRWNPLSKFSSYTYRLTLYMLSPEANNYFADVGNLPPTQADGLYVIVAQSAGINNESEPRGLTNDPEGVPGPGKEGLDFYIEDLAFKTFLLGADGQKTATTSTEFSFKIIEPLGYTFLTKLRRASQYITDNSPLLQNGDVAAKPNLYQQHYMIGIKFYGYDVNGNMLQSSMVQDSTKALNDSFALYERLFAVTANKVTFSMSGRATTYNWECTPSALQAAFGSKNGEITNNLSLQGSTVESIIGASDIKNEKSLMSQLNAVQTDKTNNANQKISTVYNVRWVKNEFWDANDLRLSRMITDEPDPATAPMSQATSTQKANVKEASKAVTIDNKSKTINIAGGMSIVSAIDQIIVKSQYISDTLSKEINSKIQAETKDNNKSYLRWYAVKPIVKCLGRDFQKKDWSYEITYEIVPYEVPYIKSPYVSSRSKYYGPVKIYEYFFTGQNTEVINFEIQYNNLFYTKAPATTTKDASGATTAKNQAISSATPTIKTTTVDSDPTAGKRNSGGAIAESVRASLYSIGDQSMASIKIVGDPDLIMDSIGSKTPESGTFSKFYGKNNSINPYGGQIFIEIVFKMAEDYRSDGLLDVDPNQTIAFYPIEDQKRIGNKGLIYKIREVNSTFSRGKFEQGLELYAVPMTELLGPEIETTDQREVAQAAGDGRQSIRRIDNELEKAAAVTQSSTNKPAKNKQKTKPVTPNVNDDNMTNYTGYESAFIPTAPSDAGREPPTPSFLSRLKNRIRQNSNPDDNTIPSLGGGP